MKSDIYDSIIYKLKTLKIYYREVIHIEEGSCEAASKIRGNDLQQAAKALILTYKINALEKFCLCVVPGDKKLDFKKVQAFVGKKVKMANVDQVIENTGCIVGAVPPFATIKPLMVLADPSILRNEEIVFNAGRLDRSIFLKSYDYKMYFDLMLINIAIDE